MVKPDKTQPATRQRDVPRRLGSLQSYIGVYMRLLLGINSTSCRVVGGPRKLG